MDFKGMLYLVLLVMLVIVLSEFKCSNGCLDHERNALLQLRTVFDSPDNLLDWVEESKHNNTTSESDCCKWNRVFCDNTTKNVIKLDLDGTKNWGLEKWYLNLTMLLPFAKLQTLDLSYNSLEGIVTDKGFDSRSRFTNLERLCLSNNNFNNNTLSFLKALPSLKTLSLLYNIALQGTLDIQDTLLNLEVFDISGTSIEEFVIPKGDKSLSKLKTLFMWNMAPNTDKIKLLQSMGSLPFLNTLYLGHNNFSETATTTKLSNIPKLEELILDNSEIHTSTLHSFDALSSLKNLSMVVSIIHGQLNAQDLPNFKKLEALNMTYSALNSKFLQSIQDMDALKVLSLRNSRLHGSLSESQGLCDSRHLQVLDLSDNYLEGTLPSCLASLASLQTLDLSNNQFTGDIAKSPITSLMLIENLYLSNNHFKIPVSFGALYNHSKLKIFEAEDILIYDDDLDPQYLFPKFQLNIIRLSGHGRFTAIPKFLYRQMDLEALYIKDVHFQGEFPYYLLEKNTKLNELVLGNNSLSGILDFSNRSYSHLKILDISNNSFYGEIPLHFGTSFPSLTNLNMSSNQFNGRIPSSFGDMSLLDTLDLSNNKLFGKIPKQLAAGCVALYILTLSHNRLEGEIFGGDFNLTGLKELRMAGNNFSEMMSNILYSTSLSVLDISDNNLSGPLPAWMGNMTSLWDLNMSKNRLEGPIPVGFCQFENLRALDLSENNISGSIPSCFSPLPIQVVRLSKNKLQGTLKHALSDSNAIMLLDLSNNQLTGSMPNWLNSLSTLNFLLLNNNHLGGELSTQLCQLETLSLINLSHNYLYGIVPDCLRITSVEEQQYTPIGEDVTMNHVEFPTKRMSYNYQGEILNMMSGIDLSCNNFFGEIPPQLGSLSSIHALNLSHNNLSGPIPSSFGNLKKVESLDLSDNLLIGKIPPELGGLFSLSVFTVANNNLSGEIPTTTQFTTFNESNFLGNPLLCGTPLPKRCNHIGPELPGNLLDDGGEDSFIDMECFYASLGATYITVLLGLVVVLMINPYWRRWWFYHVEKWITSSYYFVVDNMHKIFFPRKVSP
ncbi:hypothetical protein ACFE04_004646 [Oxalis oulophora]